MHYSVWLTPKGDVCSKLQNAIGRFSRQLNAPLFRPHVTLLGSFEMEEECAVQKMRSFAASQKVPSYGSNEGLEGGVFFWSVEGVCEIS